MGGSVRQRIKSGLSPAWGNCVALLGKTLYSHSQVYLACEPCSSKQARSAEQYKQNLGSLFAGSVYQLVSANEMLGATILWEGGG